MYGAKISAIRLARGYTQEYMANKLSIEQTSYSKIEHDAKAKISDELLTKIANVLGVSTDDIKSLTPIIMNFHDSTQSGVYSTQNNNGSDKETIQVMLKLLDAFQQRIINQNNLLSAFQQQIENQNKLIELFLEKNKGSMQD